MKKGDLTAIVCDLSLSKEETTQAQARLTEGNISYIMKEFELNEEQIVAWEAKDYEKLMEMIGNQN